MPRVSLFGTPNFEFPAPLSTKQVLLLGLLASAKKPLNRASIAKLLWPSSGTRSARHSLSQALYELRKRIGADAIASSADFLFLEQNADVDVRHFLSAISEQEFDHALRLYRGPFLASVASDSDDLDERIFQAREMLHRMAREAFFALNRELRTDIDGAADRLIEHDPFDSEVRNAQIGMLAAAGAKHRSKELFDQANQFWRDELGIPWPHPFPEGPGVGNWADDGSASAFVGRHFEMKSLDDHWSLAKNGGLQQILLIGEPGVGKTALAARFRRLLAIRGYKSFWASAHAIETRVPLGVVAQWLTRLEHPTAWPLSKAVERSLPPEFDSATLNRRRLYNSIAEFIFEREEPVCLFIDDVQWADDISIGFLGYLRREFRDHRLLVICTLRDADLSSSLKEVLGQFTLVALQPLDFSSVVELCQRSRPTQIDLTKTAQLLHERTGGNPLLLSALLAEGGSILSDDLIPTSLVDYLQPRISDVSHGAQLVLASLGVLGKAIPSQLERLGPYSEGITALLHELGTARLIKSDSEVIEPKHPLIAEVALRLVGPLLERQIRGRAAKVLNESGLTPPATLAPQFDIAGHKERAFEAADRAASASTELYAYSEAEYFLKIALANAPDIPTEIHIRCRLADVYLAQNRYSAAAEILKTPQQREWNDEAGHEIRAHRLIVQLLGMADSNVVEEGRRALKSDGLRLSSERRARLAMAYAAAAHAHGDRNRSLDGIEAVRSILPQLEKSPLRLRISLKIGALVSIYHSCREGVRQIDQIVQEASQWPDTLALAYAARGSAKIGAGESDSAERDLLQALELMESTGLNDSLFMVLNNTGTLYQETGRFAEARQLYDRALKLHEGLDLPTASQVVFDNIAALAYEEGKWEEAIATADRLLERYQRPALSTRSWLAQNSVKGLCMLAVGRLAAAHECRREIDLARSRSDYSSNDVSYIEIFFARMAEIEGRPGDAVNRLAAAAEEFHSRDFFCSARLRVERLRILAKHDPNLVIQEAGPLRELLARANANPQLEKLEATVLRARSSL